MARLWKMFYECLFEAMEPVLPRAGFLVSWERVVSVLGGKEVLERVVSIPGGKQL